MRNGMTEDGTTKSSCDGNGFKLGGSGVGTPHVIQNCIAIENLHHGFTDNNNPSALKLSNCTALVYIDVKMLWFLVVFLTQQMELLISMLI